MPKGQPVRANESLVQLVQDAVKEPEIPNLEDLFISKHPEHELIHVYSFILPGVTNEKDGSIFAAILLNSEFDFANADDSWVPFLDARFENIGMTIRNESDGTKTYVGIVTENIDPKEPEVQEVGEGED